MKNKESTEDEIVDFFKDQSGEKYSSLKKQIELHEREIAGLLNQKAIGDVLSIGGVWEFFEWNSQLKSLTILDLSKEMLEDYAAIWTVRFQSNVEYWLEFLNEQYPNTKSIDSGSGSPSRVSGRLLLERRGGARETVGPARGGDVEVPESINTSVMMALASLSICMATGSTYDFI